MSEHWFKPHRYGFGASPATWEGWAAIVAYLMALIALSAWFESHETRSAEFIIGAALLTAAFILICWRKTAGGWRWRWGDPD